MSNLSDFFAENAVKVENVKYVASKRFLRDGKPIEWEIRGATNLEIEDLRKNSKRSVKDEKGRVRTETDYSAYLGKLAALCTVYPNLNDKELQDSYKVMGADALLKVMLNPGEYSAYIEKVEEANGFRKEFDELVDEAKN